MKKVKIAHFINLIGNLFVNTLRIAYFRNGQSSSQDFVLH